MTTMDKPLDLERDNIEMSVYRSDSNGERYEINIAYKGEDITMPLYKLSTLLTMLNAVKAIYPDYVR